MRRSACILARATQPPPPPLLFLSPLPPAACTARHTRSLLYDIFTLPAIVDAPVPLLLALNKADLPESRSVEAVKALLEAEL